MLLSDMGFSCAMGYQMTLDIEPCAALQPFHNIMEELQYYVDNAERIPAPCPPGGPVRLTRPPAISSTRLNKDPSYRLSAEELVNFFISPDFRKGLKDVIILCTLMNKLQLGSVPRINRSMQNWRQLEKLSNFIKAVASDLLESGNPTQVQVSLLALRGKAKTQGLQRGVDIGVKYPEKQERNFHDAALKAGQRVTGLQMDTNKCTSQSGMTAYRLLRKEASLRPLPMDHWTISLRMYTNKCASQVGMTAPGSRGHIHDTKLGTNKCDNSSIRF
ncbi:Calponin-2 [Saguinus oedipus]|uniref:Calponin-2 n=1 Tax=Saguinus oedipus TaxID=9490 RepID=A0ABQ9VXT7_SAGOE|nr:Calponin-2 [Saguinus oedipus]